MGNSQREKLAQVIREMVDEAIFQGNLGDYDFAREKMGQAKESLDELIKMARQDQEKAQKAQASKLVERVFKGGQIPKLVKND